MTTFAILITKLAGALLHLIHRGGSLPGQIGLKLCPDIVKRLRIDCPLILVTGTNGKTSTSNMIAAMLEQEGRRVGNNRKGDNLKEGITTALLLNTTLGKRVQADAIVLEVDELNIPFIMKNLKADALVVTNFFRDQLDRAREMEQLIVKIEQAISNFEGTLILNGNDPNVVRLKDAAHKASMLSFGIERCSSSSETTKEASEGKFCPRCGSRLDYDFYQYSHIGVFHCSGCDFQTPKLDAAGCVISIPERTFVYDGKEFNAPQGGLYTMYNCMAVLAVAKLLSVDTAYAAAAFSHIKVPNGRNETFTYKGSSCILNLVKNPTGANEVMKVIEEDEDEKSILIILNDNAQDGTDVSWIYDTFFEKLMKDTTKRIIVSGSRCYDMALRLKYGGYTQHMEVQEQMKEAAAALMEAKETKYVIATYTALQPIRNILLSLGVQESKEGV